MQYLNVTPFNYQLKTTRLLSCMSDLTPPQPSLPSLKQQINPLCSSRKYPHLPLEGILSKLVSKFLHKLCEITPKKQFLWEPGQTSKSFKFHKTGLKIKKSSGRLLVTNWKNIVTRCKFLVGSLYNVNDAAIYGAIYQI